MPDMQESYSNFILRETEIDKENTWKNDKLSRKDFSHQLTSFIEKIDSSLVIGLDSDYGTGKTYFLKNWNYDLQEKHKTIYINVWDNDFQNDALEVIFEELYEQLKTQIQDNSKTKEILNKILLESKRLSITMGSKLLNTFKWIPYITADPGTATAIKVAAETVDERIKECLEKPEDELTKRKDCINNLKEYINELSKILEEGEENQNENKGEKEKLIVLIDELDRCRPSFAIEILEIIKHLFYQSKIIFVLGINISQLSHSINALYGANFQSKPYLKRFIDIEMRFPIPDNQEFIDYLMTNYHLNKLDDFQILIESFCSTSDYFNLNLRDIYKTIFLLNYSIRFLNRYDKITILYLQFLVCFKVAMSEEYKSFVSSEGDNVTSKYEDSMRAKLKRENIFLEHIQNDKFLFSLILKKSTMNKNDIINSLNQLENRKNNELNSLRKQGKNSSDKYTILTNENNIIESLRNYVSGIPDDVTLNRYFSSKIDLFNIGN